MLPLVLRCIYFFFFMSLALVVPPPLLLPTTDNLILKKRKLQTRLQPRFQKTLLFAHFPQKKYAKKSESVFIFLLLLFLATPPSRTPQVHLLVVYVRDYPNCDKCSLPYYAETPSHFACLSYFFFPSPIHFRFFFTPSRFIASLSFIRRSHTNPITKKIKRNQKKNSS